MGYCRKSHFSHHGGCGLPNIEIKKLFTVSGEEEIRVRRKEGSVGEVIRIKKRSSLQQISLRILGGVIAVFLLWIGFDPLVPWGWRVAAIIVACFIGTAMVAKSA